MSFLKEGILLSAGSAYDLLAFAMLLATLLLAVIGILRLINFTQNGGWPRLVSTTKRKIWRLKKLKSQDVDSKLVVS